MTAWKGTPGPWKIEPGANSHIFEARITDASGECVAFADGDGDEENQFIPSANAKGIAAVPKLVEALIDTLPFTLPPPVEAKIVAALKDAGVDL